MSRYVQMGLKGILASSSLCLTCFMYFWGVNENSGIMLCCMLNLLYIMLFIAPPPRGGHLLVLLIKKPSKHIVDSPFCEPVFKLVMK